MKFKDGLFIVLAIAVVCVFPAFADTLQETLGGQNASNAYHFTVEANSSNYGTLKASAGSSMSVVNRSEVTSYDNVSYETVLAADNGMTYISTYAGNAYYTLPACGSAKMQFTFVSAVAQALWIDVNSASDTIKFATLDAGDGIKSASAIGNSVTLQCYTENTWIPINMVGSFTDAGAIQ